jgi:hypothetical protein
MAGGFEIPGPCWAKDPLDPERLRWWDGTQWTGHTRQWPNEAAATSAVGADAPIASSGEPVVEARRTAAEGRAGAVVQPRPGHRRDRRWLLAGALAVAAVLAVLATRHATSSDSGYAGGTAKAASHIDLTGTGTRALPKLAATGDWDLTWSYDCARAGGTGEFAVRTYAESGGADVADPPVKNAGPKGSGVAHYHEGGTKYLVVSSTCEWSVKVAG